MIRRLAVAVGLVFAGSCAPAENEPPTTHECGPTSGTVLRAIDGDTVELTTGERIRYLLVDTPETTGGKNDCWGSEARELNRQLVEGKAVTIAYGEGCKDRFDRLLAYVSVDGREVNTVLLERGAACVLFVPPIGAARRDEFEEIEASARQAARGVWGACDPVPCE